MAEGRFQGGLYFHVAWLGEGQVLPGPRPVSGADRQWSGPWARPYDSSCRDLGRLPIAWKEGIVLTAWTNEVGGEHAATR